MTATCPPTRGFLYWALAPFLLIFVVAMPVLVQPKDTSGITFLIGLEGTGLLMLLGLFDPFRFRWAWRGVGAMVFLTYLGYIVAMLVERKWQVPARRGEANLFNAILGFIAFGLPGFWWAVHGRFPQAFQSVNSCDGDCDSIDDPTDEMQASP